MTYPTECPFCKSNLDGGSVYEAFLKKYGCAIRAKEAADSYGGGNWNRAIGIYDKRKDRTTHWQCPDCNNKWERQ
jgi:hypothetical protein